MLDNTLTLPDGADGVILSTTSTATVTNKTLTSPIINTGTFGTSILPTSADGTTLGSASKEFSDLFLADASTIQFGADQDVTLTHVADTGLLLNTTMVIQFRDSAINIGSPADGDLDINADDEIELNSTLIDINGNVEISGTAAITGIATFTDDIIIGDGKTIGSASDVDAITIASNGQVTLTQTLIGTALDISGNIDVDGTANLDVVDIDGAVNMATTLLVTGETTLQTHLNMGDGDIIKLGDSADLQIKHDGSNGYITNSTGNFLSQSGANSYIIVNSNENALAAVANGAVGLYHNNAEKFATASTGVNVTGGIGLGGTGTENILDDYEEGTFTATLAGATSNPNTAVTDTNAYYTKIGRQVNVQINFINADTTGAAGVVTVTGLPFASLNSSGDAYVGGNVAWYLRFGVNDGTDQVALSIGSNDTTIAFQVSDKNAIWTEMFHTAGSGAYFRCSTTYITAA